MITPGKRAVSVKVNDVVAVAGFVVAGTHVDVIVTGTPRSDSDATTTTVLQDVPVLAAGKQMQHDSQGRPQDVPVITLLVSPADAQLLALASSEGKIQLALRNPTDTEKKDTGPVRNSTLYGAKPAATPKTKVVYTPKTGKEVKVPVDNAYNIEVIRGDKREVNKFEGDNGSKDNSNK
jgi:pilus assembly protein CpaB